MDTLVHAVSTLWIYLRREHYIQLATEEEARLSASANRASAAERQRIERKLDEIASDLRRLRAPLTWSSLHLKKASMDSSFPEPVRQTSTLSASNETLVEVA